MEYLLIYYYHDTYVKKYNTLEELEKGIKFLKEQFANDDEFEYEAFEISKINV